MPLTEAVWGGRPLLPQADTIGVTMEVTSLLSVAESPAEEQRVSTTQP